MVNIRFVTQEDREFWFSLDKHLPAELFDSKVNERQGYVLLVDGEPVGLLRYNLFWDNTPFCNMIYVKNEHQGKGYGRQLMERWESDMTDMGFLMIMTSTQVDETSQHFYRRLGYKDSGCLLIDVPGLEQPMEMFMIKALEH